MYQYVAWMLVLLGVKADVPGTPTLVTMPSWPPESAITLFRLAFREPIIPRDTRETMRLEGNLTGFLQL